MTDISYHQSESLAFEELQGLLRDVERHERLHGTLSDLSHDKHRQLEDACELLEEIVSDKSEPQFLATCLRTLMEPRLTYTGKLSLAQFVSDTQLCIDRTNAPCRLAVYIAIYELSISERFRPSPNEIAQRIASDEFHINAIRARATKLLRKSVKSRQSHGNARQHRRRGAIK